MPRQSDSPTPQERHEDAAAFRRMAKLAADPELAERLNKFAEELETDPPSQGKASGH